jgi:glycine C-acetyltransferase
MGIVIKERKDRRRQERIPADFSVFSRNTGKIVGRAVNISTEGLFIETSDEYKKGTKLLLECALAQSSLPVKAYCVVKRTESNGTGPLGIGVEIVNIYDSDRNKLRKYIEESQNKLNSDDYYLSDFTDIPDQDLFKKTEVFWQYKLDMESKGYIRYRRPLASPSAHRVIIDDDFTGKKKEMIMMGSNNYLGLTSHPEVKKKAQEIINKYGVGAGSVPLLAGTFDIHRKLELKLAELKGCEDAIIFPSGYVTNLGCIQALVRNQDVAIIDRLAHASIIDGCLISSGTFRTFKHSDVESLENTLKRAEGNYQGKIVIVDGVYSMGGDIPPLRQITDIAHRYGAKIMVDEAHATGVIGERGKGTPSYFKMKPGEIDIVMGTLSKSLGGVGGFIASTREVVNYLRYYTRSFFFSSNFPPSVAASVIAAIDIMDKDESLHKNLWANTKYFKESLKSLGFNTAHTESAIIPVMIGDELTQKKMSRRMHEEGIYVNAIPHPAVPKGQERFRFSIMATHTREDLDRTLEVTEKLGREYGIIPKPVSLSLVKDEKRNVREISSREETEESVRFSWKVYEDYPAWVPYFLIKDQVKLISNDYHYFRKVYSKRFVVEEAGEMVGTVSAFIDNYYNSYHNTRVGFLGFFEALPGKEESVEMLLQKAEEFLLSEGAETIIGPVNGIFCLFGGGLLSSNFEMTPTFLQTYTPEYYNDYMARAGFNTIMHTLHYTIDFTPKNVEKFHSFLKKSLVKSINIRPINKSNWDEELKSILKISNDGYGKLWGNVPLDYDEFIEFANEFKSLIVPELWLIAEVEGEPVGFVGGFPNNAQIFKELNGEFNKFKIFKILMETRNIKEGTIQLIGLLDEYRTRGVAPALVSKICENMIKKGYTKMRATWILENNRDCIHLTKWAGGKLDITWRIYSKSLKSEYKYINE